MTFNGPNILTQFRFIELRLSVLFEKEYTVLKWELKSINLPQAFKVVIKLTQIKCLIKVRISFADVVYIIVKYSSVSNVNLLAQKLELSYDLSISTKSESDRCNCQTTPTTISYLGYLLAVILNLLVEGTIHDLECL